MNVIPAAKNPILREKRNPLIFGNTILFTEIHPLFRVKMPKAVALLLLNWNTPAYTANCIRSLTAHCDPSLFDIIIADNGSTDGSLEILNAQFPHLIFLDNQENLGFAEGNNRALNYSITNGYAYSLVINNDTEVDEDIITALHQHLSAHPEAAAVQPAIYWMHKRNSLWNGNGRFNPVSGRVWSDVAAAKKDVQVIKADWLTGCCMLIRNSVLINTGLFNKQFFLYYEDVELSFRLGAAGHQLHYLPGTKMYHEAGASSQVASSEKEGTLSPVIHYYVCRNQIWLLRKYANPLFYPFIILCRSPYYISLLIYFLLKGKRKKAGHLLNGIKDGFFTPEKVIWPALTKYTPAQP